LRTPIETFAPRTPPAFGDRNASFARFSGGLGPGDIGKFERNMLFVHAGYPLEQHRRNPTKLQPLSRLKYDFKEKT
jgi:hypothetical protein